MLAIAASQTYFRRCRFVSVPALRVCSEGKKWGCLMQDTLAQLEKLRKDAEDCE
jgi:hypothetical protein